MSIVLLIFALVVFLVFCILLYSLICSANHLKELSDNPTPVWECSSANVNSLSWTVSKPQPMKRKGDCYLSIIIPCYNEENRILETLESTVYFFDAFSKEISPPLKYELVIVDDGSKDQTVNVVANFANYMSMESRVRIFKLAKNCGKGAAVKEGMLKSKGSLCLIMDADGATEIAEFKTLHLQLIQQVCTDRSQLIKDLDWVTNQPGIVVGSRAHLQEASIVKRSLYRTILMHGFHFLVWFVTRTPIRDTQCGFKLCTRTAVADIFPHMKIRRWCFDVEVLLLAKKLNISVSEVSVKWQEIAGSKVKFYHILHMMWELSIIYLGYTFFSSWKVWKHNKTE